MQSLTKEEIAARGQDWYERTIRAEVDPAHHGEFVTINVDTGEYEVDADVIAAAVRAKSRFGAAPLYTVRVGHRAVYRIGGGLRFGAGA